jgi:DNA gyrase subunit A
MPATTLDHVVFFADDGTAYTMRVNEVPPSSGYGEPVPKYFKLGDQVRIVGAETTDERFTPADQPEKRGVPGGPYVLAATAFGFVLRTPLAPFRTASTKNGRRYVRLEEGDKVVFAAVVRDETSMFLASAQGRLVHFLIEQVNVLAGVGKGVLGIKLEKDDLCLGAALVSNRFSKLVVETSGGMKREFGPGAYPPTNRGGKGTDVVKRAGVARVVPPPIALVDWDDVDANGVPRRQVPEAKPEANEAERNGHADGTLFD